jgi:exodeoxyribonuclease V beta subunit
VKSFDILSKKTPLYPRFFLEASAGTGKTFAIEHLVIRLLLETPITLDQILVVTFTRGATRDLKERIYANMHKIVGGSLVFDYLKDITLDQLEKIRLALLNFDQARIFTIHGFCHKTLQELAFAASVSFDLQEWSFEEERVEIMEFLKTSSIISPHQLKRVFAFCYNDIEILVQKIIKNPGQKGRGFDDLLAELNQSIAELPPFLVSSAFEQSRVNYKEMAKEEFAAQAQLIENTLKRRKFLQEEFDWLIGQEVVFLEKIDDSNTKLRKKSSFFSLELEKLRKQICPIIEEARNYKKILFSLCNEWQKRKRELSKKYDKISPEDLLFLVQKKLKDPVFVEAAQKKYNAVIIDEFQDTDPVQWNIFQTLFVNHAEKFVYLIGDPKQSIYRFRNANIYTFFEAKKQFAHHGALTTNFRSKIKLVEELNRLMCNSPWIDLPALNTYIDVPLASTPPEQKSGGLLYFMIASGEIGRGQRWPTHSMEKNLLFPFIANEICSLKTPLQDIAVLVKDRHQALRIKEYFDECGIMATIARSPPLKDSPALELLQEVILACYGDQKLSFIKKFLLGSLVQMPMERLTTETIMKGQDTILTLVKVWEERGFSCFFAQFLQTIFWKHTTESCAKEAGIYEDVLLIAEKIIFIQDFQQILLALKKIKQTEVLDRVSSNPCGVSIMTIHASKGLEFDTVFALGVASRGVESNLTDSAEIDAEKMRELYVALTRAKTRLYIPFLIEINKKGRAESSPIEIFTKRVSLDPYMFTYIDLNQTHPQQPIFTNNIPRKNPSLEKKIKVFPKAPLYSLPALTRLYKQKQTTASNQEPGIFSLLGEKIIRAILKKFFSSKSANLHLIIKKEIKGSFLEEAQDILISIIESVLNLDLGGFSLKKIRNAFPEMEFMFKLQDVYYNCLIDLCFEYKQKYYFVSWETTPLDRYTTESVTTAMQKPKPLLQGMLYTTAIKKYLHLYGNLSFEGGFFLFVHGPAYYFFEPPSTSKDPKELR